ncbi:MAG: CRISPR-associated protein [Bryobacterales bacterium]|nr:CRISPR-associated protein [Bryobacterales bacterium]
MPETLTPDGGLESKEKKTITLTPGDVLERKEPLVLFATFEPVAGLDRFQPAGFPEVGHVTYKAPRKNGAIENVCIVDSAASMANHLEALCMRGAHDFALVDELEGMPYLRCVTGDLEDGKLPAQKREVVVTSLTEGHRIASTYFFGNRPKKSMKWDGKGAQRLTDEDAPAQKSFGDELAEPENFGIALDGSKKAHPPGDKWWNVFKTIFRYDPNALVHGVLFPQWQIKIPRVLTAHLEAFGASRVDRSGVKFDRLGKTTSGQPIFPVDDATAREIRATFILDTALVHSFGRKNGNGTVGLGDEQKSFLVALALWKIQRLLEVPFRFRSGCHLKCAKLMDDKGQEVSFAVDIKDAISQSMFEEPRVTDLFWPREELYRAGEEEEQEKSTKEADNDTNGAEDGEESE